MNYCISAAWRRGDHPVEAQIALIAAFRSSAWLGLRSLIFLLTKPHRFSLGFGSSTFAGQLTPWSLNRLLVPTLPKSCWNQLLREACQQKEALGALRFPGRWLCWLWTFRKHSRPTPAGDMAVQIITDCGNFTLDFKQCEFCASPLSPQTVEPWFTGSRLTFISILQQQSVPKSYTLVSKKYNKSFMKQNTATYIYMIIFSNV